MKFGNFIIILLPFLFFTGLCLFAIISVNTSSTDRISYNKMETELKIVREVMPIEHDNDMLTDTRAINGSTFFLSDNPVNVYRARNNGTVVGLVFMPVMANGYNGFIELAVGIDKQGMITGVRINKHQETEGFGSRIHQDNSDWIMGFKNKSLTNTEQNEWAVESDGGNFDQLSGATISPRGVINAVKKTLDYYEIYAEDLGQ